MASSPLQVGNYYAIAFDLGDMPAENVERVTNSTFESLFVDDFMLLDQSYGGYLATNALTYFAMLDMNNQMLAESMNLRWWRASPAVAVFGYTFDTDYLGSVPLTVSEGYSHIDVVRNILSIQGDPSNKKTFALLSGGMASSWESQLFGALGNTTGVSTIDVLTAANEQGVKVYYVNSTSASKVDALNISSNVKDAIKNTVNQGYDVYVPGEELTLGNWSGAGWLVIDPLTGANAWMIGDTLGTIIHGGAGYVEMGGQYVPYNEIGGITRYVDEQPVNVYMEQVQRVDRSRVSSSARYAAGAITSLVGASNGYSNRVIDYSSGDPRYTTTSGKVVSLLRTAVKTVQNYADDASRTLRNTANKYWGYSGKYTQMANRVGRKTLSGSSYLLQAGVFNAGGRASYTASKATEFAGRWLNKPVSIGGKVIGTRGGAISGKLSFIGSMITVADTRAKMKAEAARGNYHNVAVEAATGVAKVAAVGVVAAGLAVAGVTGGPAIAGGLIATGILHYGISKVAGRYKT